VIVVEGGCRIRGTDHQQSGMFSYISAEQRVSNNRALRTMRPHHRYGVLRWLGDCSIA
jgi:hypothetical protein